MGQSGVSVCWLGLEGGFERVLAVAVGSMMRERSLAASASLSHFLSQLTAFVGGVHLFMLPRDDFMLRGAMHVYSRSDWTW